MPIFNRPLNPTLPAPPPRTDYKLILADPPWATYGEAREKYPQMALADICAIPVQSWCAPEAACLLWVPNWRIQWGLDVLEAWGFKYRTIGLLWVKTKKDGGLASGTGYWTRPGTEPCLLGVRGSLKKTAAPGGREATVDQVIMAPRRAHSQKPVEQYSRIMSAFTGPYLEMFARTQTEGWDTWGNETNKFDNNHALANL